MFTSPHHSVRSPSQVLITPQGSASRSLSSSLELTASQRRISPPSFESLRVAGIVSMARLHLQAHRHSMDDPAPSSGRRDIARSALARSCAATFAAAPRAGALTSACDPRMRSAVASLARTHGAPHIRHMAASAAAQGRVERRELLAQRACARQARLVERPSGASAASTPQRAAGGARGTNGATMRVALAAALAAARAAQPVAALPLPPTPPPPHSAPSTPSRFVVNGATAGKGKGATAAAAQGGKETKPERSGARSAWPMQRPMGLGWEEDASSCVESAATPHDRAQHDLQLLRQRYERCRRELSLTRAELSKALAAGERWRIEALHAAEREAEWRLRANSVAAAAATEVAAAVAEARNILRCVEEQYEEARMSGGGGGSSCASSSLMAEPHSEPHSEPQLSSSSPPPLASSQLHTVSTTRVAPWSDTDVAETVVVARLASPDGTRSNCTAVQDLTHGGGGGTLSDDDDVGVDEDTGDTSRRSSVDSGDSEDDGDSAGVDGVAPSDTLPVVAVLPGAACRVNCGGEWLQGIVREVDSDNMAFVDLANGAEDCVEIGTPDFELLSAAAATAVIVAPPPLQQQPAAAVASGPTGSTDEAATAAAAAPAGAPTTERSGASSRVVDFELCGKRRAVRAGDEVRVVVPIPPSLSDSGVELRWTYESSAELEFSVYFEAAAPIVDGSKTWVPDVGDAVVAARGDDAEQGCVRERIVKQREGGAPCEHVWVDFTSTSPTKPAPRSAWRRLRCEWLRPAERVLVSPRSRTTGSSSSMITSKAGGTAHVVFDNGAAWWSTRTVSYTVSVLV